MLSLEGRIIIFKTLAISKIVYRTFLTAIRNSLVEELQRIQKRLYGTRHVQKVVLKHYVTIFKKGGLKQVYIPSKNFSLQCYWFRKLCDENCHEWKMILSHFISKYFGKSFKFHLCLCFDCELLIKFPEFYKNILFKIVALFFSELPSCILSNFLSFDKHISMEKQYHLFSLFFWQRPNFCLPIIWLFDNNEIIKPLSLGAVYFGFNNTFNFKWQQITYALPPFWKKIIKETDVENLLPLNNHLIKKNILVLRN